MADFSEDEHTVIDLQVDDRDEPETLEFQGACGISCQPGSYMNA